MIALDRPLEADHHIIPFKTSQDHHVTYSCCQDCRHTVHYGTVRTASPI